MPIEVQTASLNEAFDYDVGTTGFIVTVKKVFPDLSKQEIARIGWKAKTPGEFLTIYESADWWRDSENAPVVTVEVPAMNATTFASLYKGSREMRDAGCECRTTEEIFRRMLVVWAAQNNIPVDDYMLSHDDAAAYLIHVKK